MFDTKIIDDLARRLADVVPEGAKGFQQEIEKNLRSALASTLSRLDLVTREEFEVQQGVLARTREKVEALEKQVAELEGVGKATAATRQQD